MKIYNKKNFIWGIVLIALGVSNLYFYFFGNSPEIKDIVVGVFCLILAFYGISRSLSNELSRADKLEENDERNIRLKDKSNSKALNIINIMN